VAPAGRIKRYAMVRLACIDVPALALQLLLKRHPDWRSLPVAVVDRDAPHGTIACVNERAWKGRIRPGLRYAEALSIQPTLRAGAITDAGLAEGIEAVARRLQHFSPQIEPSADFPGIFWANVSGLTPLYPSLTDWARAVRADLTDAGFDSRVAVGYSRFGTYATARAYKAVVAGKGGPAAADGIVVFEASHQEAQTVRRVPLERLDLDDKMREVLAKLGIETVGTFMRLPAAGLLQRFGKQAHRLHKLATGELWAPLTAMPPEDTVQQKAVLDEAITGVVHLLTVIRRLLEPMLDGLATKQRAVTALHVLFVLDTKENRMETVQPATPTLDAGILLELLQLRLHGGRLPAGVIELELRAEDTAASHEQLRIFTAASRRNLEAGARALARLRAELGENAVVHAHLREGHLPEAGYTWVPWQPQARLTPARPRNVAVRTLIRRIYARARPLPPRPPNERNDNWLMQGLEFGPVVRLLGPYIVSGGWWKSTVHREYHFVETRRGDLLWTYYDRKRRRWFLQGKVE